MNLQRHLKEIRILWPELSYVFYARLSRCICVYFGNQMNRLMMGIGKELRPCLFQRYFKTDAPVSSLSQEVSENLHRV